MPFTGKIVAQFEHDLIGPGNQSLVGFNFNTALSEGECQASIVGYLAGLAGFFSAGTKLVGMQVRAAGAAGSIARPFPTSEYAALRLLNPTFFPAWAAYGGIPTAGGAMTPLGTSVSVTESTQQAGPRGRGRHYLPYAQVAIVAANGGVSTGSQAGIKVAYDRAFGFVDLGASVTAPRTNPAVTRAPVAVGPNPYYDITSIKVQPVFSNLRSRRR